MNNRRILIIAIAIFCTGTLTYFSMGWIMPKTADSHCSGHCQHTASAPLTNSESCVFNNLMGVHSVDSLIEAKISLDQLPPDFYLEIPEKAKKSMGEGLKWLMQAQQGNGGWGAGTHSAQHIRDPHAVSTDPATTALVALAIIREGSTFHNGTYSSELENAHEFLLTTIEESEDIAHNVTNITGTQIQAKLGASIDAILSAQYLSRSLEIIKDKKLEARTRDCLQACVKKIEHNQQADGTYAGGSWAGLLNASYAANALEAASANGIEVNEDALEKSQEVHQENYDLSSGTGSTSGGAGVMLYSVSSSSRASSTEAKKARKKIEAAKENGVLPDSATVNQANFQMLGYSPAEAAQLDMAYQVYESAKVVATTDQVMRGFGNNGGEEFLSFLQTGEGMIISEDVAWKTWYNKVSQQMVDIQEGDGSWQGHHCITSPVFCTATAVLILSVNNDIEHLASIE